MGHLAVHVVTVADGFLKALLSLNGADGTAPALSAPLCMM
jgi:hypothetical protein